MTMQQTDMVPPLSVRSLTSSIALLEEKASSASQPILLSRGRLIRLQEELQGISIHLREVASKIVRNINLSFSFTIHNKVFSMDNSWREWRIPRSWN